MESKRDQNGAGVSHWSAPWNAGWSAMSAPREVRPRTHTLSEDSERRIKRVSIAASSVAVLIWCAGIAWLWPIVA